MHAVRPDRVENADEATRQCIEAAGLSYTEDKELIRRFVESLRELKQRRSDRLNGI